MKDMVESAFAYQIIYNGCIPCDTLYIYFIEGVYTGCPNKHGIEEGLRGSYEEKALYNRSSMS